MGLQRFGKSIECYFLLLLYSGKDDRMMKYAVITGASSGIGLEMAKLLSKKGYGIVLVARRKDRLEKIAGQLPTKSVVLSADVSKREDQEKILKLVDTLNVEIFVNNAGFGDCGKFTRTSLEKERDMIDVNVTAVHVLTKGVLQRFVKRDRGYILNVASSAGLFPGGPYMATYYATKSYVVSLTRALSQELKESRSHVYIGALCPGPVDTEFNQVADVEFALPGISARSCAAYAIRQMFRRQEIIVPTFPLRMGVLLMRFVPTRLLLAIVSGQQKRKLYGK